MFVLRCEAATWFISTKFEGDTAARAKMSARSYTVPDLSPSKIEVKFSCCRRQRQQSLYQLASVQCWCSIGGALAVASVNPKLVSTPHTLSSINEVVAFSRMHKKALLTCLLSRYQLGSVVSHHRLLSCHRHHSKLNAALFVAFLSRSTKKCNEVNCIKT